MDTDPQTQGNSIAEPETAGRPTANVNAADIEAERRLIRRMQLMMNLVIQTIAQDTSLTYDDAAQMIADARRAALTMFPGKELAYDLIWQPRFQRLMRERFYLM